MIKCGGRRDVFLGTRECQAYVQPCEFGAGDNNFRGEMQLGIMYHGITYADEAELDEDKGMMTVRFWNPTMMYSPIL